MKKALAKLKTKYRQLGIAFMVLFAVSLLFPIIASVGNTKGEMLAVGYLDVAIALICILIFLLLSANGKPDEAMLIKKAQKITEYVATVPLLLIVLYFLSIQLNWEILLIGLGWRGWLLVMALPYLVRVFHNN